MADHPRECGANVHVGSVDLDGFGSSPRVRGKLLHRRDNNLCKRIIPASAGQTGFWNCALCCVPDHPRECGANGASVGEMLGNAGSSPRVRGKLGLLLNDYAAVRIIPASAGQTRISSREFQGHSDHPRECGANRGSANIVCRVRGSSPRVRGKPCRLPGAHGRRRIIPASAGQTLLVHTRIHTTPDHPRECGAN